jgi:4-aminobutyrate aminotransferase/(S)-3-amino-2-methylpropionate transaminase
MTGWQRDYPIVGDVRGLGPMMLVEFVKDQQSRTPAAPEDTLAIVKGTVARGVVLMRAGLYSNGVRLLPPLTMPEDMLREALDALGQSVAAVSARLAAGAPAGAGRT